VVDCIVGLVRVTRHVYEVPGWGVGELWLRDGVVVQHELPSEALRVAAEREAAVGAAAGVVAGAGREVAVAAELVATGPRAGPARVRGERSGTPHATRSASPNGGARLPARTLPPESPRDRAGFVLDLCRRFALHLRAERVSYDDVPLDLEWATELQRSLAAAARAIPWGEVVSYGELAALAGRPGAARAAGSFCADNRYSLIVPCHRVVAANGIGGYGSAGPELKRRLLALEGVIGL